MKRLCRVLARRARIGAGVPADVEFDRVAANVERLRALAVAGVGPPSAWAHLAAQCEHPRDRQTANQVAAALARGGPPAAAFGALAEGPAADAWRRLGAVMVLALQVGAPLAPALTDAAAGLRGAAELHRQIATSVAGPAASAKLMLAAPPGAALVAWALGFDTLRVLFATPVGAVALVVAACLLAGARTWSRRLVRRASAVPWALGLGFELVAAGVRAGLPAERALRLADDAASEVGLDLHRDRDGLRAILRFAEGAGVPVAGLLAAEAERTRRVLLAAASRRAVELAGSLLLPLTLLVLPAFLLVGVVPVAFAVLSSTGIG